MTTDVRTRTLVQAALLGGLIFISGLIRVPLGPVPFTLQTMFVLLSGLLLKPPAAIYASLLHLLLKLIFAGGAAILSPSFGFVIAFIPAAALLACLTRRRKTSSWQNVINVVLASLLIYLIGLPYMAFILRYVSGQALTVQSVLISGMLVFLPGDALKMVLALLLERRLRPLIAA